MAPTDERLNRDSATYYRSGATPITASKTDQRLHYCLYVPQGRGVGATPSEEFTPMSLFVIMHGTGRTGPEYRDALADFAEEYDTLILAPIFPAGLIDADDLHNFKFIEYRGIRFDEILLSMIDEVAQDYSIQQERFYLHGFSGGGQFVHRFFYLHPKRLRAVSIGAPGRITELNDTLPWWLGTSGFERRFGAKIDTKAMREVPVQMVVGNRDVETWEINNPGEPNWMDGAERTGNTRIVRLRTLERSFGEHGIDVQFDVVPDVAHEGMGVLENVTEFFGKIISGCKGRDLAQ